MISIYYLYNSYQSHLKDKNVAKPDTDELLEEYAMQRRHIEKELTVTINKAEINKVKFKNFTNSSLGQNVTLLTELNKLRKDNDSLKRQIEQMKIDYIPRKNLKPKRIGDPVIEELLQKAFGDDDDKVQTDSRNMIQTNTNTNSKSYMKLPRVPGHTKSMPVFKSTKK